VNLPDFCPHCGTPLDNGPDLGFPRREIGIYDIDADMVTHFECPDCRRTWPDERIRGSTIDDRLAGGSKPVPGSELRQVNIRY
jgi:hypothetical protein